CSSPPRPSSPTSRRRPPPWRTRPAAWAAWTSESAHALSAHEAGPGSSDPGPAFVCVSASMCQCAALESLGRLLLRRGGAVVPADGAGEAVDDGGDGADGDAAVLIGVVVRLRGGLAAV